jgi:hypothetical protein
VRAWPTLQIISQNALAGDAERRVRTAMLCTDEGTSVGFVFASTPTLAQGIPGFNNAGGTTGGCVGAVMSASRPGC